MSVTTGIYYNKFGTLGQTWTATSSLSVVTWQGLASSSNGQYLAATACDITGPYINVLYTSSDSGKTWIRRTMCMFTRYIIAISDNGAKVVSLSYNSNQNVIISSDYGLTWSEKQVSLTAIYTDRLNAIAATPDVTKMVVGVWGNTYIYTSTNSGDTWTQRTLPKASGVTNIYIWDVCITDDGTKMAACGYETNTGGSVDYIYVSTNSGVTWTRSAYTASRILTTSNGSIMIASGNSSYISTNFGGTWSSFSSRYIFSMSKDATIMLNVGSSNVSTSTNSGSTWNTVYVGSETGYYVGAVTGDGSAIYVYKIDGRTRLPIYVSSNFKKIVDGQDIGTLFKPYSSGTQNTTGIFRQTVDIGTLFNPYSSGTQNTTGIYKYNPEMTWTTRTSAGARMWFGLASSSDGAKLAFSAYSGQYIWTSTDSGVNWLQRTSSGASNWQWGESSDDGTKLLFTSDSGTISTSTDSGATWKQSTSLVPGCRSFAASSSDGTKYAVALFSATLGYIYTSTDSGATWTKRMTDIARTWYCIASSSDGSKLVAGVIPGYIYTSTDSGVNWTVRTSDAQRSWRVIASSSDGNKLVACQDYGTIWTSSDSGVNWISRTQASNQYWTAVASSSDGNILVANGGYIYTSLDSGVTWTFTTALGSAFRYNLRVSSDGSKAITASYSSSGQIFTAVRKPQIDIGTFFQPGCTAIGTYTITYVNNKTIITFLSGSGSISFNSATTITYLVVGGGGGGGVSMGSGGGGGGVLTGTYTMAANTVFKIGVGTGGEGSYNTLYRGRCGGDSYILYVAQAFGGCGGTGKSIIQTPEDYFSSGGGGAKNAVTGTVAFAQGYNGGNATQTILANTYECYASGGGGGAGGAGGSGVSNGTFAGGSGGIGISSSITGSVVYYGGGGGGAIELYAGTNYTTTPSLGGIGGGGNGGVLRANESSYRSGIIFSSYNTPYTSTNSSANPTNGTNNTGGGGGGGNGEITTNRGGDGGSGIVIISF
jgi:hypothetical protein